MEPISRQIHQEILDKAKENKHILMGYLFLALVFVGVLSSVYYWQYKANAYQNHLVIPKHVESGETADNQQMCIQVITLAKNTSTGQTKDFPTPCDVPSGWEITK